MLARTGALASSVDREGDSGMAREDPLIRAAKAALAKDPAISAWTHFDEIDPRLVAAVVLAEDRHFWRHGGIDSSAVGAAARKNLQQRMLFWGASMVLLLTENRLFRGPHGRAWSRVQAGAEKILSGPWIKWGASTIPMQVARMLRGWSKRSYVRKLREALLALWLVARHERYTILEVYLNMASFARGTRGVAAGSSQLIGSDPGQLSAFDATLLAAAVSVHPEPAHESLAQFADWLQYTQVRLVAELSESRHLDASDAATAAAQIAARWREVKPLPPSRSRARHRVLAWALAQIGTTDGAGGSNSDGRVEAWQREFGLSGVSWCGCFIGYGLRAVGDIRGIDQRTVWIPFVPEDARAGRGGWKGLLGPSDAVPGDVAVFCWDGSGEPQHIGFVVANDQVGRTIYTVEGNTTEDGAAGDQSDGHGVFARQRSYEHVLTCARPRYPRHEERLRVSSANELASRARR